MTKGILPEKHELELQFCPASVMPMQGSFCLISEDLSKLSILHPTGDEKIESTFARFPGLSKIRHLLSRRRRPGTLPMAISDAGELLICFGEQVVSIIDSNVYEWKLPFSCNDMMYQNNSFAFIPRNPFPNSNELDQRCILYAAKKFGGDFEELVRVSPAFVNVKSSSIGSGLIPNLRFGQSNAGKILTYLDSSYFLCSFSLDGQLLERIYLPKKVSTKKLRTLTNSFIAVSRQNVFFASQYKDRFIVLSRDSLDTISKDGTVLQSQRNHRPLFNRMCLIDKYLFLSSWLPRKQGCRALIEYLN